MEIPKFLIGILVFTAIVLGFTLIIGDLNNSYQGVGANVSTSDFGDVYDTTDELYNISNDMKNSVLGGDVDEDSTEDSMFKGAYKAVRFTRESFGLVGDIINSIANVLPIPAPFVALALTAIVILVIFAFIYLIFRVVR